MIEAGKITDAIDKFKTGLNLFHRVAIPPHRDTYVAQESLRACIADNGNTYIF